ncbi:hypothetical protein Sme01_69800 [Sphaerisporangium melleum]|uniref:CHRD domain-containing protein n=1 Tax=Sphaerisporangium melleum TaxID=321316 RepID=A0A917VTN4_9ACTN|nr:CHRD domain-containing protein [Sphaerisporangium melleum]GGL13476.1 hypothetical protein GCM10007964_64460 [Sphaerisporangium melleum]GII74504.1 hypothetical protein Sme01_69800 [Sphaerisporangium melleum]
MNVEQTNKTGKANLSWSKTMSRVAVGTATAALALGALTLPAGAATAAHGGHSGHSSHTTTSHPTSSQHIVHGKSYYFAAVLLGRNEVREPGKKVNDRDGLAVAKFRIQGNRLSYIVQWKRTGKPTAFHIHRGKAGVNGPVVIDLSKGKRRGNTLSGTVVVDDLSVLKGIKNNPKNWYSNFHSSQFPDGAVRGQLHKGGRW